jgi:hypothetical protein
MQNINWIWKHIEQGMSYEMKHYAVCKVKDWKYFLSVISIFQ